MYVESSFCFAVLRGLVGSRYHCTPQSRSSLSWVAVKEFRLSYHYKEALIVAICT